MFYYRFDNDSHAGLPADPRQILSGGEEDLTGTDCVIERIDAQRPHSDEHLSRHWIGLREFNGLFSSYPP
jgi:hypothetical protein